MDTKTIKLLITEAKKNEKRATAEWQEHDSSEDMHEMEMWIDVIAWLQHKLAA